MLIAIAIAEIALAGWAYHDGDTVGARWSVLYAHLAIILDAIWRVARGSGEG